ncbi:uncharacterized protein A4U43_C09F13310 [Asparagus officinalis]|uniref:Uncharacterized protein n=1 Tax=Asparagus officinalis TaxID=4686 RepID=A0A5P1E943_ASPOF|nr:uncharacterized protein A4U43_C09F13310 [Asparagus officinalis]
MDRVWTAYHRLLGVAISLRANQEAGSGQTAEMTTKSVLEVDRLKQRLEESEKKAERIEEVLQEKESTKALAKTEKEAAVYASLPDSKDPIGGSRRLAHCVPSR